MRGQLAGLPGDLVVARSPEESRRRLAEALSGGAGGRASGRRRAKADEPEERFRLELREILLDDGRWVFTFQRPSWDTHAQALRTAIDGFKGWLDLALFRLPGPDGEPPVMGFSELKVRPHRPTPEQWAYLGLLRGSGVRHAYLWTPDTMEQIRVWLTCPYGVELPPAPDAWLAEPPKGVGFPPQGWLDVWARHWQRRSRASGRRR